MYPYFDSALDVGLYPTCKVLSGPNTVLLTRPYDFIRQVPGPVEFCKRPIFQKREKGLLSDASHILTTLHCDNTGFRQVLGYRGSRAF